MSEERLRHIEEGLKEIKKEIRALNGLLTGDNGTPGIRLRIGKLEDRFKLMLFAVSGAWSLCLILVAEFIKRLIR